MLLYSNSCAHTWSRTELAVIFFLFDKNGDGLIDFDEFCTVMRSRKQRGMDTARDIGLVSFLQRGLKCSRQVWDE